MVHTTLRLSESTLVLKRSVRIYICRIKLLIVHYEYLSITLLIVLEKVATICFVEDSAYGSDPLLQDQVSTSDVEAKKKWCDGYRARPKQSSFWNKAKQYGEKTRICTKTIEGITAYKKWVIYGMNKIISQLREGKGPWALHFSLESSRRANVWM